MSLSLSLPVCVSVRACVQEGLYNLPGLACVFKLCAHMSTNSGTFRINHIHAYILVRNMCVNVCIV
jgi:hypothetical protein